MEETVKLEDLTPEQIKKLQIELAERQKADADKRNADRLALLDLEDGAVGETMEEVELLSNAIVTFKQRCIHKFEPLMKMKTELGKAAEKQRSYTFNSKDKHLRIIVKYNETIKHDDGILACMEYSKQWLTEGAEEGDRAKMMGSIIENLLVQSRTGKYSTDNLLIFIRSAEDFDSPLLKLAADSAKRSLYKENTSVSVSVYKKDEFGTMRQLPLSATKA